ncbi:hypothetical protein AXX17_AT4G18780 [Arabidopsis thaliana]|uniref:MATH domain-containing protein n=1 Tax=Arabidopsis thaliana TaxID=3702 RepID=A0A178UZN0_ARATH|nr:hypothetical protein AXX17_AT4G18780 [Arabidopsis thaliana]
MSEITNNETSGEGTLTNNVNDCGSNPSELYGTFTWKIHKFSQINEGEIRSNVFEIGGHRWYLLIYPRGVDVSNCLSLFLCVANYEKLLPGWSHLAQFSVAVENKDPKKSKIADTLHQFWKKEHDWGWKKFIELPILQDGFIDKFDSLAFKAQVQVIRECVNRPFRCLDGHYRKELRKGFLEKVEKMFMSFVEEKRSKLMKSLEEKRRRLERLASVVARGLIISNQIESAIKTLEEETKKERTNDDKEFALKINEDETKNERTIDAIEFEASIAYVVNDMFGVNDPLLRLERFVLAPLPEMGSPKLVQISNLRIQHNMEPDEKQLADYGRWALEVFVLDHIFCNKIEFTYEETIALKRQEELIHEEEAEKNTKLKKTFVGKKVN